MDMIDMESTPEQTSLLDKPLTALVKFDWERALLITLLVLAILTRLWDLSYRAWNHDEAIHTDWAWNLYTGRGYQHNPIYHGPFLYHVTALSFFLFGDNDTTARLPNALFGIVLVSLPYFFRKWLGRKGTLATMAMLLISPAVLYYSRFNRHDIYVEVFVVLMALTIFKYFDERKEIWLIAAAALLALSYTAMETTFIFLAIFAIFLCAHFTYEYLRPRVKWRNWSLGAFAAVLGIPYFGGCIVYWSIRSLARRTKPANPEALVEAWRQIPSFDLAMIFGTFSLPLLTPALFYVLNIIWKRVWAVDFFSISAFTDVNVLTQIAQQQPDMVVRVIGLTGAMIFLAALIGVWWNARVWTISAVLFWPIFVLFFTTVFTNGGGFFTGTLGSLGYWLSQQEVARGGQPWYYYLLVLLPMYELLPYLVGLAAMFWYWWRYRPARLLVVLIWLLWCILYYIGVRPLLVGALPNSAALFEQLPVVFVAVLLPLVFFATFDSENPASVFPTFFFTWVVGVMIIFSWAGEKMPWLTMHFTIPLAFVSGWAIEKLLDADWRNLLTRGAIWLALLIPLALILGVMLLTGQPFQGVTLDQLSATNGFIVSLVMLIVIVAPALFVIGRRFTRHEIARVAGVTLVVVLAALTIRFAWMAVYIEPDVAAETMIYAQGSHDDVTAMREIEDLSRRLCSQSNATQTLAIPCDNGTIKVAYDDDSSWPFVWYLRNYRNAQYYGANPNAPFDAVVVIAGDKNEEAIKPYLGNKYVKRRYKLIWWPIEGYKDLTAERVASYIRDPQQRLDLFTAWFFHQYKESASQWPYVHNFSFYVRKDVAGMLWNYTGQVPTQTQDEYDKKFAPLAATRAIGAPGNANGQFNNPKNIALDAQGNLYVADSDNNRIEKFDATGKFLLAWGTRSPDNAPAPNGTFNQPWGIAVDRSGNVYVADTWNHRIQKFDATGKFLLAWGVNGDTRGVAKDNPLFLYGPRAIVIDAQGNVLVTDTGNKRVLKFSPQGEPLAQYGGVGSGNGQFLEQVGLALDQQGNLYVADTWNQRIQKFDSNFNFVTQWAVTAWDTQSVVGKPFLAVDSTGNVFASDPDNSRVLKFSSDGTLLSVFGVRGVDLASFNLPTGLAFDAQDNLYVADSGNNRILVFTKP